MIITDRLCEMILSDDLAMRDLAKEIVTAKGSTYFEYNYKNHRLVLTLPSYINNRNTDWYMTNAFVYLKSNLIEKISRVDNLENTWSIQWSL